MDPDSSHLYTSERFTPWQIVVSTLTTVYALRNLDKILGLGGENFISIDTSARDFYLRFSVPTAPEPLARLVSHGMLCSTHAYNKLRKTYSYNRSILLRIIEQHGFPQAWMQASQPPWPYARDGSGISALSCSQLTIYFTRMKPMRRYVHCKNKLDFPDLSEVA